MASPIFLSLLVTCVIIIPEVTSNIRLNGVNNAIVRQRRIICAGDTLLVYQDCKMCVCPRPNRAATCYRKSCDLRTKDGGMCPSAVLKLDDANLCKARPNNAGSCKTDNDCPGPQFCCFDFCDGAKCVDPVPFDNPQWKAHPGRGFPV